jgi:hypothetical protein
VDGEVRFDPGTRGAYAHDGSNYRQPPLGVVMPRSADAAVSAIGVRAEFDAPGAALDKVNDACGSTD